MDHPKELDIIREPLSRSHDDEREADTMSESVAKQLPFGRTGFKGLAARCRSRLKLWLYVLGKWFITLIFIAVIYTILGVYDQYQVITEKQKKHFNVLITGFLIALGLVTTSQLIGATSDLRWWILSRRPRSRGKVRHHGIESITFTEIKRCICLYR